LASNARVGRRGIAVEIFNYVMVLVSIISGLAITQLFQGVAQIIQAPGRAKVYWVHLVWVLSNFFWVVFWWWFEFSLSKQAWTFQLYLFVISYVVVLYLRCAITFPDSSEGFGDLRAYYYSRRGVFFGLVILQTLVDIVDTLLKGWAHLVELGPSYWIGMPALLLAAAIAIKTRNHIYHAVCAVGMLSYGVVFAMSLFNTVQ
jgi:hypothetical protein